MPPQMRSEAPAMERRVFAMRGLEVRAKKDDDGAIPVTGYAAVFNSRSHVLNDFWTGPFVEEIEPGAFAKSIKDGDVRFLINHDPNLVLARTRSKTLRLSEDDTGLKVDADMAPTTYADDLAISMRRGDVSQMSFAFRTVKDEWAETEDGMPLRRLLEVHLFDTSAVTYPAYEATEVGLRGRQFVSAEDVERFLTETIYEEINPASLPVLRAARTALDARLAQVEPHEQHSTRPIGLMKRKHALNAERYGLNG